MVMSITKTTKTRQDIKPKEIWENFSLEEWVEEEIKLRSKLDNMDMRDSGYLKTLHELGRCVYRLEKLDEAVDIASRIAAWHAMMDGRDTSMYAASLSNLANVLFTQGRIDEGKIHLDRAMRIQNVNHGSDSRESTKVKARYYQYNIESDYDGIDQQTYQDQLSKYILNTSENENINSNAEL